MSTALALTVPALLMGLAGSGHCAVMCGSVASAVCGRPKASLAFNIGRVLTYAALGAVAGAIGGTFTLATVALRPLAAIALVGLGLHLAGVTSLFASVERLGAPLWRRIAPLTKRPLPTFALGALWGLVPCGLVYAAVAVAATAGSAAHGALVMLAFGAGTLPLMTLLAALAGPVVGRVTRHAFVRRTAGLFVLLLGVHQASLAFAAVDLDVTGQHAACHGHRGGP